MCGRINVSDHQGVQALMRMLGAPIVPDVEPRWNVSPTAILNAVVAVGFDADAPLHTTAMRWGIKAPWAEPGKSARPLINARGETLFSKPTFRDLAKAHRAIVPVNGFYEWERRDDKRVPYYVRVNAQPAMLLATVFQPLSESDLKKERASARAAKHRRTTTPEPAQLGFAFDEPAPETNADITTTYATTTDQRPAGSPTDAAVFTADFAVVTTEASGELAAIHHRTPVMLNTEQAQRWLRSEDRGELEAMMAPDAVMAVELVEVSDAVNSSRNDGPECVRVVKR